MSEMPFSTLCACGHRSGVHLTRAPRACTATDENNGTRCWCGEFMVLNKDMSNRVTDLIAVGLMPKKIELQPPKPEGDDVLPEAIAYLIKKEHAGAAKYGQHLRTHDGRDLRDALEEAADLYLYLHRECKKLGLV